MKKIFAVALAINLLIPSLPVFADTDEPIGTIFHILETVNEEGTVVSTKVAVGSVYLNEDGDAVGDIPASLDENARIEVVIDQAGETQAMRVPSDYDPEMDVLEPSKSNTATTPVSNKIIAELGLSNLDPKQIDEIYEGIKAKFDSLLEENPVSSMDDAISMMEGYMKFHTGDILAVINDAGVIVEPEAKIKAAIIGASEGLALNDEGILDPTAAIEPSGKTLDELPSGIEFAALGEHLPAFMRGEAGEAAFYAIAGENKGHPDNFDMSKIGPNDFSLAEPISVKIGKRLPDGSDLPDGVEVKDPSQLPTKRLGVIGAGSIMKFDPAGIAKFKEQIAAMPEGQKPQFPPNAPFMPFDPSELGAKVLSADEYAVVKATQGKTPGFAADGNSVLVPYGFKSSVDAKSGVYQMPASEQMTAFLANQGQGPKGKMPGADFPGGTTQAWGAPPQDVITGMAGALKNLPKAAFTQMGVETPPGHVAFNPQGLQPDDFQGFKDQAADFKPAFDPTKVHVPAGQVEKLFQDNAGFAGMTPEQMKAQFDSLSKEEQAALLAGNFTHQEPPAMGDGGQQQGPKNGPKNPGKDGAGSGTTQNPPPNKDGGSGTADNPPPNNDGGEVVHQDPPPNKDGGEVVHQDPPPNKDGGEVVHQDPPPTNDGGEVVHQDPPPTNDGGEFKDAPPPSTLVSSRSRSFSTRSTLSVDTENTDRAIYVRSDSAKTAKVGTKTIMLLDTDQKTKKLTASKGVFSIGKVKTANKKAIVPIIVDPALETESVTVNLAFPDDSVDIVTVTLNSDDSTELVTQMSGDDIQMTTANSGIEDFDFTKVVGYLLSSASSTLKIQKAIKLKGTLTEGETGQLIEFDTSKKNLDDGVYTIVFEDNDQTYYGRVTIGTLKARTLKIKL